MENLSFFVNLVLVIGILIGLFKFIVGIFKCDKMEKELIQEENIENYAQSNFKSFSTGQLLKENLIKIGCKLKKIDDDALEFAYQGGNFFISFNDDSPHIMVGVYIMGSSAPMTIDMLNKTMIMNIVYESRMPYFRPSSYYPDAFRILDNPDIINPCREECEQCWHKEIIDDSNVVDICRVDFSINELSHELSLYSQKTFLFFKEIPRIEDYLCRFLQDLLRSRNYVYNRIEKNA